MKETISFVRKPVALSLPDGRLRGEFIVPEARQVSPPGAPTLIFLHEGLGCIGQWRDFPDELCVAAGLTGFVYERKGHGRSDPLVRTRTVEYLHEEALRVLPAVLSQAGITTAILIGHSDGGSMALLFAAAYPERVLGVVTEAAHVFVEDVTLAGIRKTAELYETSPLKQQLEKYHGANTEALFHAWADTWLAPDFRDWSIEYCLDRIRCPLLAIQGRDDEYGTPLQVETIVALAGEKAHPLILDGCGHIPHHQARREVLAAVVPFLADCITKSV